MTGHLTHAGTICQNSGHDWEGFVAEILRYGLCCPDVRRVGEAVQQLRIYLGDGV